MGIQGKLRDILRRDATCAPFFQAHRPTADERKGMPMADLSDALADRWRSMRLADRSRIMTMAQLCAVWISMFITQSIDEGFTLIVRMVDIGSLVTKQKAREQWKRKQEIDKGIERKVSGNSKGTGPLVLPYPPSSRFDPDTGELILPTGRTKQIDLDRFYISARSLRKEVWMFILKTLSVSRVRDKWPDGVVVLLDFVPGGPHVFTKGLPPFQMEALSHPFGEADMMVPFYLRWLRNSHHCVVRSIDSDVILILLNYIDMTCTSDDDKRLMVLLDRPGLKVEEGDAMIDIRGLHRAIGPRLFGVTAASIMSGTDFVMKSTLTPNIGADFLIEWALLGYCRYTSPVGWNMHGILRDNPDRWDGAFASPDLFPDEKSPHDTVPVETKLVGIIGEMKAAKLTMTSKWKKKTLSAKLATRINSKDEHLVVECIGLTDWVFNYHYWRPNWFYIQIDACIGPPEWRALFVPPLI
jgi:hypothetical protein